MSSIIDGYSYDIFISYRQKDNKYDGWVSEFVDNLKKELEATIKEDVSLYFDINPHDGLLETHDVDASLKEKLKCLIFIPIISRTYCDPKSFAWEHEFRAFVEMASNDETGLKVRVQNGNVCSRVLPVRIHELDHEDIIECESVLGGVLRGIEFIYRSAGVNRPLRLVEEKPKDNLNGTIYRDQINKVANTVKEILYSLKSSTWKINGNKDNGNIIGKVVSDIKDPNRKFKMSRFWLATIVMLLLILVIGIILSPLIFKKGQVTKYQSENKISVAILPFRNLTNEETKNKLQTSIQEVIGITINCDNIVPIHSYDVLDILERSSIKDYAALDDKTGWDIIRNFKVDILITGSIIEVGNEVRLMAECVDFKTRKTLHPFVITASHRDSSIVSGAYELGVQVRDYLLVELLRKDTGTNPNIRKLLTNSPEALIAFTEGLLSYKKLEFPMAVEYFETALKCDSGFVLAMIHLASCYNNLASNYPMLDNMSNQYKAKLWKERAYQHRTLLTGFDRSFIETTCSPSIDPSVRLKSLRAMKEMYGNPESLYNIGLYNLRANNLKEATIDLAKSLEGYEEMGIVPWLPNYLYLAQAYYLSKKGKLAERTFNEAEKYYHNNLRLILSRARMYLIEGNTLKASEYIEKMQTLYNDSLLLYNLTRLFSSAKLNEKAEEYYNKSLKVYPRNPVIMNEMAYFLIENKKVQEGMDLADSALAIKPNYFGYMETKAWGYYRQKKYYEALDLMLKAMELRKECWAYNPYANWHIDSVRQAIERLSNNVQ